MVCMCMDVYTGENTHLVWGSPPRPRPRLVILTHFSHKVMVTQEGVSLVF